MTEKDRQAGNEGEVYLTPINPFTAAQQRVIRSKLRGLTNKEIAHEQGRSVRTVVNHITGISERIGSVTGSRPHGGGWLQAMFGDVILTKPSESFEEK